MVENGKNIQRNLEFESLQYYKLPKYLFLEERFKGLSIEAKVLYAVFLDRARLSYKNKWQDNKRNIFIYFTIKEMTNFLNISKNKVYILLGELENHNLIKRERQGLGKPNFIYIENIGV